MFNHVFAKVSRRVAIISLIATFSVVGIISCGGSDDITGGSGYSRVDGGDNGGPVRTNDSNLPDMPYSLAVKPSWATNQDDGTHYKIYIPFWGWTNVSYKDTTTLNKLYRQFIESGRGGRSNPGQSRWFIRNGNNFLSNPIEGEYYYFDKDLNIRYHGSIPGYEKRVMYRYLGAVIINYSWNNGEGGWGNGSGPGLLAGRWTIGGLYQHGMNKLDDPEYGAGYFKYEGAGKDELRNFMRSMERRQREHVQVILMNEGYSDGRYVEFGLDMYLCVTSGTYNDIQYKQVEYRNYYLGADPAIYTKKLAFRTNMSWMWGKADGKDYMNFKFFSHTPSGWHLE